MKFQAQIKGLIDRGYRVCFELNGSVALESGDACYLGKGGTLKASLDRAAHNLLTRNDVEDARIDTMLCKLARLGCRVEMDVGPLRAVVRTRKLDGDWIGTFEAPALTQALREAVESLSPKREGGR